MAVRGRRRIGVDELHVVYGEDRLVICCAGGRRGLVAVVVEYGGLRRPVLGAAAAALPLALGFAAHC